MSARFRSIRLSGGLTGPSHDGPLPDRSVRQHRSGPRVLVFPCEPHSRGHGTDGRSDIRPSPVHSAQGRVDGAPSGHVPLAKSARSPGISPIRSAIGPPRTYYSRSSALWTHVRRLGASWRCRVAMRSLRDTAAAPSNQ